MNKKITSSIILCVTLLFSSCWIYPDYKEYEIINDVYFFKDYDTMKSVIIPEINKSFSAWHWSGKEFDIKWNKYFGNVSANADDYQMLISKGYSYAVRSPSSLSIQITGTNGSSQQNVSKCYWFTTEENKGVLFYQN